MAKHYNVTTGPAQKYVDSGVNGTQIAAICSCNHLTPRLEAKMENLIKDRKWQDTPPEGAWSELPPTDAEIARQNTPIVETPVVEDWTIEEPSKKDLDEIEREEKSRVTC